MAQTGQSDVNILYTGTPPLQPSGQFYGSRLRRFRAVVTYAAQTVGTLALLQIPAGMVFAFGIITADTSSGSTTIAIGDTTTAAKHKAAAAFTSTDTPTLFGKAAAVAEAGHTGNAADTVQNIIATLAAATAPGSGTLVIDMYFSGF